MTHFLFAELLKLNRAGAVSIRAFEGSRWCGGEVGLKLWVLNAGGAA
jgi:hypothetical protein